MTPAQISVVIVALLTFRLWVLAATCRWRHRKAFAQDDVLGEAHREWLKGVSRYILHPMVPSLSVLALSLPLLPQLHWERVDPEQVLRPLILILSGIVTWRAVTLDVDLATGISNAAARVVMILAWIGVWFYPVCVILVLHVGITWLRSDTHHQHLPLTILFMFLAGLGAIPLVALVDKSPAPQAAPLLPPLLFLFLCISASHFFVPGAKKALLGRSWYSWAVQNRLHSLSMSAYLWGWLRFVPEGIAIRFVRTLRPITPIAQFSVLSVELGSLFILFEQHGSLILLAAFVVFQAFVMLLSGICFWQFMVTNSALLWAVAVLPPDVADSLFGLWQGVSAAAVIWLLPYQGRVWKPKGLAWWDSSFVCGARYEVRGQSGAMYSLGNDFMCPHERLFGITYGQFLSKEKRVTSHIGETYDLQIRDALYAVATDINALSRVKERYGESLYDQALERLHDRYMVAFIKGFNAGHRKRVVPAWLKAPGGQFFYWGRHPRFRGQEPIDELVVRYSEEYFDGERIHVLIDDVVKRIGRDQIHGEAT